MSALQGLPEDTPVATLRALALEGLRRTLLEGLRRSMDEARRPKPPAPTPTTARMGFREADDFE